MIYREAPETSLGSLKVLILKRRAPRPGDEGAQIVENEEGRSNASTKQPRDTEGSHPMTRANISQANNEIIRDDTDATTHPEEALGERRIKVWVFFNRNLQHYPLARHRRCKLDWKQSKKSGRWLCDLTNEIQVRLPANVTEKQKVAPSGFDIAITLALVREQRFKGKFELRLSGVDLLRAIGLPATGYNYQRLRATLSYLSQVRNLDAPLVRRRHARTEAPPATDPKAGTRRAHALVHHGQPAMGVQEGRRILHADPDRSAIGRNGAGPPPVPVDATAGIALIAAAAGQDTPHHPVSKAGIEKRRQRPPGVASGQYHRDAVAARPRWRFEPRIQVGAGFARSFRPSGKRRRHGCANANGSNARSPNGNTPMRSSKMRNAGGSSNGRWDRGPHSIFGPNRPNTTTTRSTDVPNVNYEGAQRQL